MTVSEQEPQARRAAGAQPGRAEPDPRIRVLHVITELVVGGAQDNTYLTVEGLDRSRYRVDLLGGAGGTTEERARAVADRLYVLPDLTRSFSVRDHARAAAQIARVLRRERYHVVHTHCTNAGLVGRWAAALARTPVVVHTFHTLPGEDRTFPRALRPLYLAVERATSRATDGLVTVCDSNRERSLELRLGPPERLTTVLSGIDLRRFADGPAPGAARRALGLEEDWPVVGYVARLAEQNAPEVFVEAARRCLRENPRTYFVMVGSGPLEEEVRELARAFPQIRLAGHRDDIPRVLRAFDVYVSTAAWAGLGRSLTEAMITGRPVVATAVGGVPELVRGGETGILVPPGDPAAVHAAVRSLLDDPAYARRLGENARAAVVPRFGADRMVAGIDALYVQLLRRKGIAVPDARAP